jgi:hypothetical protein
MTQSKLGIYWDWDEGMGPSLSLNDGNLSVGSGFDGEVGDIDLTYASALNLASKLLQWATNLPESEKGNIHKIDGEWMDVDAPSTE